MKLITFFLSIVFVTLVLSGCTRPDQTTKLLASQGFTDIQIQSFDLMSPLRCSDDDQFFTPFVATSPAGVQVKGVVCQGLLKGATIRF